MKESKVKVIVVKVSSVSFSFECAHLNLHSSASDKMKQVGSFLLQMQAVFYYSPLHSLAL